MNTMPDPKLTDRPAVAIRDVMRKGKHPTVLEVKDVPGGLTQIDGTRAWQ